MTNDEPGRDGPHKLWATIQQSKRHNWLKTTSAFKSIERMIQQGEPVSKEQILRAMFSANMEMKNNPSKQTTTKETEEEMKKPRKVTFANAPPGEGSPKSKCRRFPREIREEYEKLDMWYTEEDEDQFEVDWESHCAMMEIEKELETNPKVTVQQRKVPKPAAVRSEMQQYIRAHSSRKKTN